MWQLANTIPEITLEHGERAEAAMSFTDGYGHLHLIWDDQQLMLINGANGRAMNHWPSEIVRAVAAWLALPTASSSDDTSGADATFSTLQKYMAPEAALCELAWPDAHSTAIVRIPAEVELRTYNLLTREVSYEIRCTARWPDIQAQRQRQHDPTYAFLSTYPPSGPGNQIYCFPYPWTALTCLPGWDGCGWYFCGKDWSAIHGPCSTLEETQEAKKACEALP